MCHYQAVSRLFTPPPHTMRSYQIKNEKDGKTHTEQATSFGALCRKIEQFPSASLLGILGAPYSVASLDWYMFATTLDKYGKALPGSQRSLHIRIDGLVYLEEQGCGAILGLKRVIQERAEKELGIPTVTIEASSTDSSYVDEATITAKLDEFAQTLLSQKGLA